MFDTEFMLYVIQVREWNEHGILFKFSPESGRYHVPVYSPCICR